MENTGGFLMFLVKFPIFIALTILITACATSQSINIETSPPGAAISVDQEYIGRSPTTVDISDVDDIRNLRIVAEKAQFNTSSKTLKKKRNGLFPEQVFLKLDQPVNLMGGGSGQQQGGQQTTIQGPTIIVPGVNGGAAQVIQPK